MGYPRGLEDEAADGYEDHRRSDSQNCTLVRTVTVFLSASRSCVSLVELQKIDRSLAIVLETEQTADRPNLCLKSRAQISDGPGRRSFIAHGKNLRRKFSALPWLKTIEWE
jgi:hypothetical protein